MKEMPECLWGDVETEWKAIPARDIEQAIEMMNTRCTSLFGNRLHSDQVQSVIVGRLYQARRSWQNKERQKRRARMTNDSGNGVAASSESAPPVVGEAVGQRDVMAVEFVLRDRDEQS